MQPKISPKQQNQTEINKMANPSYHEFQKTHTGTIESPYITHKKRPNIQPSFSLPASSSPFSFPALGYTTAEWTIKIRWVKVRRSILAAPHRHLEHLYKQPVFCRRIPTAPKRTRKTAGFSGAGNRQVQRRPPKASRWAPTTKSRRPRRRAGRKGRRPAPPASPKREP